MRTTASIIAVIAIAAATACPAPARPLHAMDTCTKVRYPKSEVHSPEQQLDWLRARGYAGIAWTADEPAEVARVAEAAAQRGVPMSAIYLSANLERDGLKADPRFETIADALASHGTLVWIHIVSKDFSPSDAAGDAIAIPGLRRLADVASARGLKLAIYPHHKDWTERTSDAIRIANAVDHPSLGVGFNLCHALMAGEEPRISELLGQAGKRLLSVTLNGADAEAAGTSWRRLIQPVGRGSFDLRGLLAILDRIGFQGPVFQQGYGIGMPPEELLESSMREWRAIVGDPPPPVR